MRIPVIALAPRQEPLVESALAAAEARAPNISLESARTPTGFEIDTRFAAVPVGTGSPASMTLESVQPNQSDQFAIRGFVEADEPDAVPETVGGVPVFSDPHIAPMLTCGGTPPLGNAKSVATKLKVATLRARGLDGSGVAVAIMDTGINLTHLRKKLGTTPAMDVANSWRAPGNPNAPFAHPLDHGTMCAYDALIAAPKATLLDFPILASTAPGGAITGSTLSVALLAFSQLLATWAVAFAPGGTQKYKALVVNNSWGIFHPSWDFPVGHPGRYIDNPNHAFNLIVNVLAGTGADILFAAGNCGGQCADGRCQGRTTDTIMGANALQSVLTLAGCDTNDQRVGYSSQGPSIPNMFPQKPDVTCYTHFSGSEAFGAGSPDSGTSAACPVASGCIAAVRTKVAPGATPPAALFQQAMATARHVGSGTGWNRDTGHGILDADSLARSLGV